MSTGGDTIPDRSVIILKVLVGSSLHGTSILGTDDRDELGILIEPPQNIIGLSKFETSVWRTKPEGVRSEPGDIDRTLHSLKKYVALAAKGNPTIISLLYAPEEFILTITIQGHRLLEQKDILVSKRAGAQFLGYITAQRQKINGERGGGHGWRQDLIEKYGYDTKYAGHLIRLGYQGIEYMETGHITLPMKGHERFRVIDIRTGKVPFKEVIDESMELENKILELYRGRSPLPDHPDMNGIDNFLVSMYQEQWNMTSGRKA